jgi:predicted ribosome quality control (RQC) complex YloA/Tae2 family protein
MDRLLGARVQQVLLVDERSIALELYAGERINLLASADPQAPRILVTPEKYRRGVEGDPPFLLLLRKWVRMAKAQCWRRSSTLIPR